MFGIINFLKEAELLSEKAAKAAKDLVEIRNKYVHARGKNHEKDASDAIKYLHVIVEDTVSIFKDFDLQHGVMMFKDMDTSGGAFRAKYTKVKSQIK